MQGASFNLKSSSHKPLSSPLILPYSNYQISSCALNVIHTSINRINSENTPLFFTFYHWPVMQKIEWAKNGTPIPLLAGKKWNGVPVLAAKKYCQKWNCCAF